MNEIEKVNDFLGQAQTFYLTTVDGDRPKCRPVAFHMISGDRVYFGIGDFKEVYKQMQKIYNEQTGYKLEIFHLEDATAEFRGMLGINETYSFA